MMPPNGMPPGGPPVQPPLQPPGGIPPAPGMAPPGAPGMNVGQMPVDPQALAAMLQQGGGQPVPSGPPMMGPNGPVPPGVPRPY